MQTSGNLMFKRAFSALKKGGVDKYEQGFMRYAFHAPITLDVIFHF